MTTKPRRQAAAPTTLLVCACLAGTIWAVTIALVSTGGSELILVPGVLASIALAFAYGHALGCRGTEEARATGAARQALAEAQARLAAARLERSEHQVRLLLEHIAPGAALFDPERRLVSWTRGFAALAAVPDKIMASGNAIGQVIGQQPTDAAQRMPLDRLLEGVAGAGTRQREDGSLVEDRWTPLPDGSLLLSCRATGQVADARGAASLFGLCADNLRNRLPLLRAALAGRDITTAEAHAEAMRGVASNFGLAAVVEALDVIISRLGNGMAESVDQRLTHLAMLLDREIEELGIG